jgi:hypothetical protein
VGPQLAAHQEVEQQCDRDEEGQLLDGFYNKAPVWIWNENRDKPAGEQNL